MAHLLHKGENSLYTMCLYSHLWYTQKYYTAAYVKILIYDKTTTNRVYSTVFQTRYKFKNPVNVFILKGCVNNDTVIETHLDALYSF